MGLFTTRKSALEFNTSACARSVNWLKARHEGGSAANASRLTNGTLGTVRDFIWAPGDKPHDDLPAIIFIEPDTPFYAPTPYYPVASQTSRAHDGFRSHPSVTRGPKAPSAARAVNSRSCSPGR